MRTKNSIINIVASLVSYFIVTLTSLIIPKILDTLGQFTPAIENTFLNTISLMNMVELGIGIAIVYKLYEPIEKKDYNKIAVILNFYKSAYKVIAVILFSIGIIMSFFVYRFLDANALEHYNKSWLSFVFMFYVFEVLASYLFAHKRAMLSADQKNYINNICHGVGVFLSCILQILILNLFHSFLVYAFVRVVCTALENTVICVIYNKKYKNINLKTKDKLSPEEKDDMFKNLKALLLHKMAGVTLTSTPNLVMSSFNTIASIHYSTYMRIINGVIKVTDQIFGGITASFGNLLVTESKKIVYDRFKAVYFINHLLYSFLSVGLFTCINVFITMYKADWLMHNSSVSIIILYFYLMGMRQSILIVKTSAGIYRPDRFFALLEAFLNVFFAISLSKIWGINGILFANILSMLTVPMWTQPYLVYRNVFDQKLRSYYKSFAVYALLTLLYVLITSYMCSFISVQNLFLNLIIRIILSCIIPNTLNLIIFWRTEEMSYVKNLFLKFIVKKNRKCLD